MVKVNVMYPHTESARRPRLLPRPAHTDGGVDAGHFLRLLHRSKRALRQSARCTARLRGDARSSAAEGYEAAMREHDAEIRGDIANYINIAPMLEFSEVVVERSNR